jgi:hypothetical protein
MVEDSALEVKTEAGYSEVVSDEGSGFTSTETEADDQAGN